MSKTQKEKNTMVDWQPWHDETFQKAKEQNKPIFISVGYPSCYWCEVMDKKVFTNKECVDILNKHFICIKVDKDERPDIDKYYQEVHQLLNNRVGGWPTSIFATPQNKPFFAGTYIAVESEVGSIEGMGFLELSKLISHKIAQNDENLYKNADEVEEFLSKENHPKEATVLSKDFIKTFMLQAKDNYDAKYGGFSSAPKFPHANTLNALMVIDELYSDKIAKEMVIHTLDAMSQNSFFDKKEGAFYRYSNNESFSQPSGDKTIHDNALLCEVYTKAYKLYKDENYLKVAKSCADYISINDAKLPQSAMISSSLFRICDIDESYTNQAIESLNKPQEIRFLDDYAFLIRAFVDGYNITNNELYIIQAQKLTNEALARFYKNGAWYFSDNEFKTKAKPSIMIENLLSVSKLTKDEKYTHFAYKTLQYNSYELARKPILYPTILVGMLTYLDN